MAYTYIGSGTNSANSATISYTPTAGHFLVIYTVTSGGGGNPFISAVSDTGSGSWNGVFAAVNNTANKVNDGTNHYWGAFYQPNCAAGITSVTVTFNGGTPSGCLIVIAEYSGIASSSPLIVFGNATQASPGTSSNAVTTGNINVTGQPALLLGFCGDSSNNGNSMTAGTSPAFTSRLTGNQSSIGFVLEDSRVTATGNTQVTATDSGGSASTNVSIGIAFLEASSLSPLQKTTASAVSNPNSFTVTLSGVTAGSLLTLQYSGLCGASGANNVSLNTPTDSNGNVWQLATNYSGNNAGGVGSVIAGIAYCKSANAGSHTIVVSCGAGGSVLSIAQGHATLAEWSSASFGPNTNVDATAFANATTAQAVTSGTTSTTTSAVELVLAAVAVQASVGVANNAISDPPSGFTSMYVQKVTNAADIGAEHCYLVTSSTGAQSASWSWTDATTAISQGTIAALANTPTNTTVFYRPAIQFVDESVIQN